MLQPSSIDVRLDRFFRVFENHRYPHIDPAADQSDLTREVEPEGDEPFILHPGEFVLGSTYEVVTPARRHRRAGRGQVLAGPARAAHPRHGRLRRPRLLRPRDPRAGQRRDAADQALPGHEDRPVLLLPALLALASTPTARRSTARATRASAARRRRARSRTSTARRSDAAEAVLSTFGTGRRSVAPERVLRRHRAGVRSRVSCRSGRRQPAQALGEPVPAAGRRRQVVLAARVIAVGDLRDGPAASIIGWLSYMVGLLWWSVRGWWCGACGRALRPRLRTMSPLTVVARTSRWSWPGLGLAGALEGGADRGPRRWRCRSTPGRRPGRRRARRRRRPCR